MRHITIYTESGLVQRVALDSNTNEPVRVIVVDDGEPQKMIWAKREALNEAVAELAIDCSRRELLAIAYDECGARLLRLGRTRHSSAAESLAAGVALLREAEALFARAMALSEVEPDDPEPEANAA